MLIKQAAACGLPPKGYPSRSVAWRRATHPSRSIPEGCEGGCVGRHMTFFRQNEGAFRRLSVCRRLATDGLIRGWLSNPCSAQGQLYRGRSELVLQWFAE